MNTILNNLKDGDFVKVTFDRWLDSDGIAHSNGVCYGIVKGAYDSVKGVIPCHIMISAARTLKSDSYTEIGIVDSDVTYMTPEKRIAFLAECNKRGYVWDGKNAICINTTRPEHVCNMIQSAFDDLINLSQSASDEETIVNDEPTVSAEDIIDISGNWMKGYLNDNLVRKYKDYMNSLIKK